MAVDEARDEEAALPVDDACSRGDIRKRFGEDAVDAAVTAKDGQARPERAGRVIEDGDVAKEDGLEGHAGNCSMDGGRRRTGSRGRGPVESGAGRNDE